MKEEISLFIISPGSCQQEEVIQYIGWRAGCKVKDEGGEVMPEVKNEGGGGERTKCLPPCVC